jgi:hypothetical protein
MIEEDFYCTIKFKNGEEIFAKVAAMEEDERTFLLVSNPVIICEVLKRSGVVGYKVEPWLKTTTEDLFILNIDDVLTMSESSDVEMIMMHQSFVRQNIKNTNYNKQTKIDRKMGYISNVNDAKEILEKLFKNS